MYLDLGLCSHYLFTVVLHSIRDIPILDNVVDVIDARVGQAELVVSVSSLCRWKVEE
jgi:hypothetical protein